MSIPQGGYAFPSLLDKDMPRNCVLFLGMTLRDYFAAKAISQVIAREMSQQGTWKHFCVQSIEMMADQSYRVADAMLKARES